MTTKEDMKDKMKIIKKKNSLRVFYIQKILIQLEFK